MMALNENLWSRHQHGVLVSFVRHHSYRRVLSDILSDVKPGNEFWAQTAEAHLLRSVVDWCMIFGANNSAIHWKRVVVGPAEQEALRQQLLAKSGQQPDEWESHWKSMISFRNGYAAHRAFATAYPSVPFMEKSLQIAIAYDDWIRPRIRAEVPGPSIENMYKHYMSTMPSMVKRLVELTPQAEEETGPGSHGRRLFPC